MYMYRTALSDKGLLEGLTTKYESAFTALAVEEPGKHPHAVAEYKNGTTHVVPLRKLSPGQIARNLDALAQRRGRKLSALSKVNRVVSNASQGNPDARLLSPDGRKGPSQGSVQGIAGGLGPPRPSRSSKEGRTPRKSPTLSRKLNP